MNQSTTMEFSLGLKAAGESIIDAGHFRERFKLSQQALARLAGVHRATVADAPSNEKLQNFMRESLRVVSAAAEIAGNDDNAVYWMRNSPIPEFGHQFAMDLVAKGKTEAVIKYLQSVESGFSG